MHPRICGGGDIRVVPGVDQTVHVRLWHQILSGALKQRLVAAGPCTRVVGARSRTWFSHAPRDPGQTALDCVAVGVVQLVGAYDVVRGRDDASGICPRDRWAARSSGRAAWRRVFVLATPASTSFGTPASRRSWRSSSAKPSSSSFLVRCDRGHGGQREEAQKHTYSTSAGPCAKSDLALSSSARESSALRAHHYR